MGKFLKIFLSIVIFGVIILGIVDYSGLFDIKTKLRPGECQAYSTKTDAQSKKNISEIINTLANTSTVGLAFKAGHLRKLGDEVDRKVPSPLTFLHAIFSRPELARAMIKVKQSSMKYNNFCEGLYPNMQRDYKSQRCFKKNLYAFAKSLNLNQEKTFTVAETCGRHGESGDKDAFRPFVDYLIEQKAR
jgi:hypothetical protein